MQTQGRILQTLGNHSPEGIAAGGCFAGHKLSKADKAAGGKPANSFLNAVFRPIPATQLNPLFNRKNYRFLYESARNYSKLLGSSFDLSSDEKDFKKLFRYLEGRLPERQHLLLIEKNKKLLFKIWFGDDFLMGEVFFIPVQVLNRTEGVFRDILLLFFQLFQQMHKLARKEHLYDYEITVDGYLYEWYEPDGDPKLREFLKAYKEGYIHDTFSLVYQKPNHTIKELEKRIKSYIPKNEPEGKLIVSVMQGINILRMNKNIFNYVRRPEANDGNFYDVDDDCVIEAERMLRFVYSGSDYVSESFLEYINTESQDMPNEYFTRNSLILSPETNRLLEVDFVECFFTWLVEFINILYDYE